MNLKNSLVGLVFILFFALSGYGSGTEKKSESRDAVNWPKYRGFNGDGISQEIGLLKSWSETAPTEVWRIPIGVGYSPIIAVNGSVFTMESSGDSEFLLCLNAANGQEIWRIKIGPNFRSSYGDGPRSCPLADEDLVYALGAQGHLIAVKMQTGAEVWRQDIKQKFTFRDPAYWHGFSSSPFIEKNMLLLNVGGSENQSIAALNKKTGETIWTTHTDFAAYSTPTAVDFKDKRQFIFVTAQNVVSVSASGDIFWKYPWEGNIIKIAMPIFVPPDKIFVSASYGIGGVLLQMQANGDSISVAEVWTSQIMSNHFNSSIRLGKYLYGFDNGTFKCIEIETKTQMWAKRRLGKGSLIYADGHFIVLSDRGKLVLVEANPNEYVEKGSLQVLTGRSWTPPTLSNGKLFLRNQKEMVCLNIKKAKL